MPDEILMELRRRLTDEEFDRLLAATDGGRALPFGPEADERADVLVADADESLLDLFARCAAFLDLAADEDLPAACPAAERLVFTFEEGSAQLEHFLGSLFRNGFAASAVEAGETHVFVHIEAASDLDFYRAAEVVKSLYEISSVAIGKRLRGHRLE